MGAKGIGRREMHIVAHRLTTDMVAVTHLELEVSIASLIEIVIDRHTEVELLQLKGVASSEARRQLAVVRKLIAKVQVKLIDETTSLAIPHIQWVHDRIDADVASVVHAERGLDTVEHVVADGIPQHTLGPILSVPMQTVGGIDRVLAPFVKHCLVERQFFLSQFLRPHPCHKVKVFLLVGTHTVFQGFRQASIGNAMSEILLPRKSKRSCVVPFFG